MFRLLLASIVFLSGCAISESTNSSPNERFSTKHSEIEEIIIEESNLRGINPNVALKVYYSEGKGAYQSRVKPSSSGVSTVGGTEASFGPYQLYIGGGLGNLYQNATGRKLIHDNTREGITKQIQFALDMAVAGGWGPWHGYKGGDWDGLSGAKQIGNWR